MFLCINLSHYKDSVIWKPILTAAPWNYIEFSMVLWERREYLTVWELKGSIFSFCRWGSCNWNANKLTQSPISIGDRIPITGLFHCHHVTKFDRGKNADQINEEGNAYFTLNHLLSRVGTEKSHKVRVKPKIGSCFFRIFGKSKSQKRTK